MGRLRLGREEVRAEVVADGAPSTTGARTTSSATKAAMNGTWKTRQFYYGSMKDGFTLLAPYGPGVSAATKTLIAQQRRADRQRQVERVPAARSTTRAASCASRRAQRADRRRPLRDELARQGRHREPEGLEPTGRARPRVSPALSSMPAAVELRGITKRFPASSRTTGSTSRRPRARCTRCSARTAPASRRSRTSSPGSTARTTGEIYLHGERGRVRLAAGRARRGHLHGAPALPARRAVHRRRERDPRRPPRRGEEVHRQPAPHRAARRRARRALPHRRRSARAHLAALARRAAARRDPEGALPRGARS